MDYSFFYFWLFYKFYSEQEVISKLKKHKFEDIKSKESPINKHIFEIFIILYYTSNSIPLINKDKSNTYNQRYKSLDNICYYSHKLIILYPKRKYTSNSKYNIQKVKTILLKVSEKSEFQKSIFIFVSFTSWIDNGIIKELQKIINGNEIFF